ncbi:MAG: tripartite tricarboxylate transporter TctB family protein [Saccharofermentanales bacterium]|jgi:putative tricarboxylic transport membrane protein
MNEEKVTRQEIISGVVFFLFGVYIIQYSYRFLNFGSFSKPGSGFVPLISGAGIALIALIWVLVNTIGKKPVSEPLWANGIWKQPLLAMLISLAYALLIDPLGYVLATFVFMVVWQIVLVREKWWKILLIGFISTISVYYVFVQLLRVFVPKGPLGF